MGEVTNIEVDLDSSQTIIILDAFLPIYPVRTGPIHEIYVVLVRKGGESVVDDLKSSTE